jgi:hypothetical protein
MRITQTGDYNNSGYVVRKSADAFREECFAVGQNIGPPLGGRPRKIRVKRFHKSNSEFFGWMIFSRVRNVYQSSRSGQTSAIPMLGQVREAAFRV